MKFVIACDWQMAGEFTVEANSLEEAIEKVNASEPPYDGLPEDGEYVDDSFNVNTDCCRVLEE